jgi:alpha-tubulin suppressor-like RCC1 family protein
MFQLRSVTNSCGRSLLVIGVLAAPAALVAAAGWSAPAPAAQSVPAKPAHPAVSASAVVQHWGAYADLFTIRDVRTRPVGLRLPGRVAEISTSNSTDYALLTNGQVYAWGLGKHGQLGNGRTGNSFRHPVRVQFPPGVRIKSIPIDVMPYDIGLALDTTGHVWGWGLNNAGQLCLGGTRMHTRPVKLPFADVTSYAGAGGHAQYEAHGRVYACGLNHEGELGDGTVKSSTRPVVVRLPRSAQVRKLVASYANSGAVLANGTYYDWGLNAAGQVGIGTRGGPVAMPVQVKLPHRVRQVFQGGSLPRNGQTLALLSNGALYAWGDGRQYQLGTGNTRSQPLPVLVGLPAGLSFRVVATGGATSYGITRHGNVFAWGANGLGQVGNGSTTNVPRPVWVASHAVSVSATADGVLISLRK